MRRKRLRELEQFIMLENIHLPDDYKKTNNLIMSFVRMCDMGI